LIRRRRIAACAHEIGKRKAKMMLRLILSFVQSMRTAEKQIIIKKCATIRVI
jgi:hypothetical protein